MSRYECRSCGTNLVHTFVDLGATPLANSFLKEESLDVAEPIFSLHVRVCHVCFLVQLPAMETPENIFRDYAYFSSFSKTWLEHAKAYSEKMIARFELGPESLVVEVASNDGYLLQYFKEPGVPVLGIEPAENVAKTAVEKGIETRTDFFGSSTAGSMVADAKKADLIAANNVLAHVPDINDFVKGFSVLLKPNGVATFEFPHLLNLVRENQFDTIYHEHFSYLSLIALEGIFKRQGLQVFDIEKLTTHGGSLRVFVQKKESGSHDITDAVERVRSEEQDAGLNDIAQMAGFDEQVKRTKRELLSVLIDIKNQGKSIAGYGAAAKGNTLLNYCGIGTDFLDYVVDANPVKQDTYLPGTRLKVTSHEAIKESKPDYVLILPWNLAEEIVGQNEIIRQWGGKFITPIPTVKVF